MARACAVLSERDYVTPEDVREVFGDVSAHRLVMKPQARIEGVGPYDVVDSVLASVQPPSMSARRRA